jgi:SAM-dependent methyltransferase
MSAVRLLVPAPLRPAARRLKHTLRSLRTVRHDSPLESDCRAAVAVAKPVLYAEAGRPVSVSLALTNHTPSAIGSRGPWPVGVAAVWTSYTGGSCGVPDGFAPLPKPLWPGESLTHAFLFPAPASLGDYGVEFKLIQRGGAAFEHVGPRAKIDLAVTTPLDESFNYHDIYANADLSKDYWSASGPPSQAEFERLIPIKLKLLTDQGFTPDGKLLDVGCGTGLLTTAAERFLSDRGLYWGTDLAKEAVAFCRRRFRRPNFHFAVNGMTTIPVDGVLFDAITYFSVFTHTYVEETTLLLAESRRLLAPGGFVFADVFTSPLVERSLGSRYAVEVNRDLLLRLAGLAGLKAELVMASSWRGQARREFFKFTHR